MTRTDRPVQSIATYPGRAFRVAQGANLGDGMGKMSELVPDDVYQLALDARRQRLSLETLGDGTFRREAQRRWGRHLLVDEFQDLTPAHLLLLRLLAAPALLASNVARISSALVLKGAAPVASKH